MRVSRVVLPCFCLIATLGCHREPETARAAPEEAIRQEISHLRDLPDAQRRIHTKNLALRIQRLPAAPVKVTLAASLTSLSTEGDFGRETLQEVTTRLGQALKTSAARLSEDASPASRATLRLTALVTTTSCTAAAEPH